MSRRIVHISMIAFALLIGRAPAWVISACCLAALFFNWLILPRLTSRALQRDKAKRFDAGLLWYPAALLIVSLIFQKSLIFLVIGWGAMAFGDAAAGIFGGGKTVPWHPLKTRRGSIAFVLLGTLFTMAFLHVFPDSLGFGQTNSHWLAVVCMAMMAAGLTESVPDLIDDNFSVPLTGSVVAWIAHTVLLNPPVAPNNWPLGLVVILLLMGGAWLSKKIDLPGAILGGILSWLLWAGCGWLGLGLITSLFVLGSIASRWGREQKAKMGLAQERKGKRGIPNVLANALIAGFAGLLAWSLPEDRLLWTAVAAAALAAATSDTLASEFGTLYGRRFVHVFRFTAMARGEDGAISVEGSFAGLLGAGFIALLLGLGTGAWLLALLVGIAGLFGNWLDSVLGATLQRAGLLNNHTVNLGCTLGAAVLVMLLVL